MTPQQKAELKKELDRRMEEAKKVIKSLHDGTWQADYSQVNIHPLMEV